MLLYCNHLCVSLHTVNRRMYTDIQYEVWRIGNCALYTCVECCIGRIGVKQVQLYIVRQWSARLVKPLSVAVFSGQTPWQLTSQVSTLLVACWSDVIKISSETFSVWCRNDCWINYQVINVSYRDYFCHHAKDTFDIKSYNIWSIYPISETEAFSGRYFQKYRTTLSNKSQRKILRKADKRRNWLIE